MNPQKKVLAILWLIVCILTVMHLVRYGGEPLSVVSAIAAVSPLLWGSMQLFFGATWTGVAKWFQEVTDWFFQDELLWTLTFVGLIFLAGVLIKSIYSPRPFQAGISHVQVDAVHSNTLSGIQDEVAGGYPPGLEGYSSRIIRFSVCSSDPRQAFISVGIETLGGKSLDFEEVGAGCNGDLNNIKLSGYVIVGNWPGAYLASSVGPRTLGGQDSSTQYVLRVFGMPGTKHTARIRIDVKDSQTNRFEGPQIGPGFEIAFPRE